MIYLYVLFEMSAAGQVYKWRIPQPDMKTCIEVMAKTKNMVPNETTENEIMAVVTCGGDKIERFYGGKWYQDSSSKN